jgi:hypothetical protein
MLRQVLPRAQLILVARLISSHTNMRDVFVAIALIPKAFVFNEAGLAPRVANAELGISETELIERLFDAALPQVLVSSGSIEHAFYRAKDSKTSAGTQKTVAGRPPTRDGCAWWARQE